MGQGGHNKLSDSVLEGLLYFILLILLDKEIMICVDMFA